ncbi:hypothetical protein CPB83DRAFT_860375 [Crepidotus variabilis]|uniref:F-box domain-containing protein n=1 Tax=Crepidotus variabilis TaxID=179855 RepID=A0A9P6E9X0_9AGAR|nr:hypothetical protein CPB83DRAFT_860375 [Crepidotus variabilis]
MSLLQLPAELLDAVLSYLWAENDIISLWQCSLTCRILVSPAQAFIFRNLKINFPSTIAPAILEYRPYILPLIQHLELIEIHKPWVQNCEAIQRLLKMLSPYVTSLELIQRRPNVDKPRFELSSLWQLKCLEKITLSEELQGANFGRPMHDNLALSTFLNHFPKLRAITFSSCLVPIQIIDKRNPKSSPVFQLEYLKLKYCQDMLTLDWLVPAMVSLRNLHFQIPRAVDQPLFYDILFRMIKISASSLERLTINGVNLIDKAHLQFLMDGIRIHNNNLCSMNLIMSKGRSQTDQMSSIIHCLQTIGPLPQIRYLVIGLYQTILDGATHLNDLEGLIVSPNFPELQFVEIRPILMNLDVEAFSPGVLLAAFPRLTKKKMISMRIAGKYDWD